MNGHPDPDTALAALDQIMKLAALAKSALLGQDTAALLISAQDLSAAQESPGNPYGHTPECLAVINHSSSQCICAEAKHGRYDAASAAEAGRCDADWGSATLAQRCTKEVGHDGAHLDSTGYVFGAHAALALDAASPAEVAEGAEPEGIELCGAREEAGWMCFRADGHAGPHEADGPTMANPLITWEDPRPPEPGLCPAQWGEPPETGLCSLPSGHDGNHATAEGIEWAGDWQTAEPGAHAEPAAGTSVNPTIPGRDCAVPGGRELWFCHGCREFHGPGADGDAR